MGMLSKAMKKKAIQEAEKQLEQTIMSTRFIEVDEGLMPTLEIIAERNNTTINTIINTKIRALVNNYEVGKVLNLTDVMPFGQYRGVIVEDLIRTDPRYVSWLVSTSSVFELDGEGLELLNELHTKKG